MAGRRGGEVGLEAAGCARRGWAEIVAGWGGGVRGAGMRV